MESESASRSWYGSWPQHVVDRGDRVLDARPAAATAPRAPATVPSWSAITLGYTGRRRV
jgi:hypothetical protein